MERRVLHQILGFEIVGDPTQATGTPSLPRSDGCRWDAGGLGMGTLTSGCCCPTRARSCHQVPAVPPSLLYMHRLPLPLAGTPPIT